MRISSVTRCRRLARNVRGRDWVVGDLHGHRAAFERELDCLGFDPARDRVLSVGDLVDRGPDSLGTLTLIEEPWFHAVLGNHELMLLNYLRFYSSRLHARKLYPCGGGGWIEEAMARHRKLLRRLADRVIELPIALHVEGDVPFNVMHGDLHPLGARQASLFSDDGCSLDLADAATSSRANIADAPRFESAGLHFARHEVRISDTPLGDLPITYVGHSPMRQVTVHRSYVYIDQGVCARWSRLGRPQSPTVLDHRAFAYWLGGVTVANEGRALAA